MTLRWMEGFEIDRTAKEIARVYYANTLAGNSAYRSDTVAYGGFCLRATNSGTAASFGIAGIGTLDATLIVGMRIRVNKPALLINLIDVRSAADANLFTLIVKSAGGTDFALQVKQGATDFGSTGEVYLPNQWYYVEMKVKFAAGTGIVHVRVDGVTAIGDDTANDNTGATVHDKLIFQPQPSADGASYFEIDDIYVLDGAGVAPTNNFLGNQAVECMEINDDHPTFQQWNMQNNGPGTKHHEMVDDNDSATPPYTSGDSDDDDTALWTAEDGKFDLWKHASPRFATGTINGIQLDADARLRTTGSKKIKLIWAQGAVTTLGPDFTVASTAYARFRRTIDANDAQAPPDPEAADNYFGVQSQA